MLTKLFCISVPSPQFNAIIFSRVLFCLIRLHILCIFVHILSSIFYDLFNFALVLYGVELEKKKERKKARRKTRKKRIVDFVCLLIHLKKKE